MEFKIFTKRIKEMKAQEIEKWISDTKHLLIKNDIEMTRISLPSQMYCILRNHVKQIDLGMDYTRYFPGESFEMGNITIKCLERDHLPIKIY